MERRVDLMLVIIKAGSNFVLYLYIYMFMTSPFLVVDACN